MSSPSTPLIEADEEPAEAWARSLAMRQLQVLGELAEQGLEIGRAIERRAKAAEPGEPSGVDLNAVAMAHARVARAVRLTIMLQSRLIADVQAGEEGAARKAAAAARQEARLDPEYVHKARVERIVERVAMAEHGDDEDEMDRLTTEASERLDDDDLYPDPLSRPIGALVASLCRDLGLDPDWTRLAEEAWAKAEVESGAPGSPFVHTAPMRSMAGGEPPAAERVVEGEGGVHDVETSRVPIMLRRSG
jgi:hypothetical protein